MIAYKIQKNKIIAYFYHNDEQNDVTYWTEDISYMIERKLRIKNDYLGYFIKDITISVLMHKTNFYGIAKCSPDDIFNEKIGKEIAKKRLIRNFYKCYDKVLQKVINEINNIPHVKYHILKENEFKHIIDDIHTKADTTLMMEKAFAYHNDVEIYNGKGAK